MRLAVSNIAWDISEDVSIAALLTKYGVDAIDVAPGKYFPNPADARDKDIAQIRKWWASRGIEITGMQALLFGTTGMNVFGDNRSQQAMLEHLRAVCCIGAGLGATRLVFGSPKNRDRTGLNDNQALEQAVSFFHSLGDIAKEHGVIVCLEPNPTRYGANFMMNSADTANVVTNVAHSAIRMQFDTGAITINSESPKNVLDSYAGLVGHIHASEPDLKPLGDGETDHKLMHQVLDKHLLGHVVSIEMVATTDEPHLTAIERALLCAVNNYRKEDGASR
ncbi:MAG: sugar phosphate isomerase/epimerase [Thalassolituus oleivorans]|uniref:sugar phosphate isomerase/epimerase family protein n=1 Tax=Thalassolituus oleivorans TaxID=187493 RepID=UPI001B6BDDDD|nr:TIM barrel protein [Thalassolituus oleivorans]MBQ0727311.1 sugar phosphate isomerase/epimerase [Thalassolituus oleivorans]MBQ0780583.1 sugar phosphate isomerase/epimerase [Thalassolituus oleivorans]